MISLLEVVVAVSTTIAMHSVAAMLVVMISELLHLEETTSTSVLLLLLLYPPLLRIAGALLLLHSPAVVVAGKHLGSEFSFGVRCGKEWALALYFALQYFSENGMDLGNGWGFSGDHR